MPALQDGSDIRLIRSTRFASLRSAMPVGDRRSRPATPLGLNGEAAAR